jgi:hypothetical protein
LTTCPPSAWGDDGNLAGSDQFISYHVSLPQGKDTDTCILTITVTAGEEQSTDSILLNIRRETAQDLPGYFDPYLPPLHATIEQMNGQADGLVSFYWDPINMQGHGFNKLELIKLNPDDPDNAETLLPSLPGPPPAPFPLNKTDVTATVPLNPHFPESTEVPVILRLTYHPYDEITKAPDENQIKTVEQRKTVQADAPVIVWFGFVEDADPQKPHYPSSDPVPAMVGQPLPLHVMVRRTTLGDLIPPTEITPDCDFGNNPAVGNAGGAFFFTPEAPGPATLTCTLQEGQTVTGGFLANPYLLSMNLKVDAAAAPACPGTTDVNGECWVKAQPNENCDTACTGAGTVCADPATLWNDIGGATCLTLVPDAEYSGGANEPHAPYYNGIANRCFSRVPDYPYLPPEDVCNQMPVNAGEQRICRCE